MEPDLGLIFGSSAAITLITLGAGCCITVASFGFVGAILWFTLRPLLQNAQQRRAILQSGIPATAAILQLAETGMFVNHQPQVRIALQVNPPNGAPYQTEVTMVISPLQIPRVQPGLVVPVKIDPQDPAKVALML